MFCPKGVTFRYIYGGGKGVTFREGSPKGVTFRYLGDHLIGWKGQLRRKPWA